MDVEYYVGAAGNYDLFKMRDEAERRQRGDYHNKPASSKLHFHKAGEECNGRCESYPAKEDKEV
jgi:hypothetical protein